VVDTLEMAAELSNIIAPEHLQLSVKNPEHLATLLTNYGGLFIGEGSAEVIGDYCAGPNHVLPTGGTGRFRGGLSVFDFLKVATWLRIDDTEKAANLYDDAMKLGKLEGLEGHYQAAKQRLKSE
jgi:phosphoribosyl-ATP pyrophosphohydrolase/phosphoribosyl-AMP cyclohydrolase/histidinol dehydrogenase